MFLHDLPFVFIWWSVFFFIGILFLPIILVIFSRFVDRGYVFSKVFGIVILSYAIFLLGTLRIAPFTYPTILIFFFVFGIGSIFFVKTQRLLFRSLPWKIFIIEELLFFLTLTFWSYIRAHEPSIHGLEKYMDFGFVNSVLRADYFPARDLWLTPESINYYYFGHVVTAVLTKLSSIDPAITYNLMMATLFALTFMGAFSIGANLVHQLKAQNAKLKTATQNLKLIIAGGLLAGFLVALAGNLHTIYAFFNAYNGENPVPFWTLPIDLNLDNYWYPNATRFIPLTIHEFPIYSFVVSDLHGHVLSIPIVLTIIAVLLSLTQNSNLKTQNYNSKLKTFSSQLFTFHFSLFTLLAFLLATAYMTNAWDGLIYGILTGLLFLYLAYRSKSYTLYAKRYMLIVIGSIIFSVPFSIFFKPFVSGIGILCAPEFLTNIGNIGPFLFEADHCQKSPLYQLLILHGFWYFWVISFIFFLWKKTSRILPSDTFIIILIGLSTVLILVPEFIYAKDIYPGHYRANTMFKLGYEAFIMLGIASAYIIVRLISNIKYQILKIFNLYFVYFVFAFLLFILVLIYPYFAINSYYGELKVYRGLNGLVYLGNLYTVDYEAILWIKENVKGQPVILEAAGESYTDYARVSVNTGLPTVIGWPVHEWLWRGSYDEAGKRVSEVEKLYTTADINEAKRLLEIYNIEYVFVGLLERQKYSALNEEVFKTLGMPIYKNEQTVIYQLRNHPS